MKFKMSHSLILGMTESGKSTLAKRLSKDFLDRGWHVVLYDPLNDTGWSYSYKAKDIWDILNYLRQAEKCMVFIDEAGTICGHYDKQAMWLATQSRHWGHNVFFISQRCKQIAPTVREQCSFLFLFSTSKKDSEELANEFNRDELRTSNTLKQGEYFYVQKHGELKKLKLF